MSHDHSTRHELGRLVALAVPAAATQLAAMSFWMVDLAVLGRLGVEAIDAASLGRLWIMGTVVFALGILFGVDPLVAQAAGAGDERGLAASLGAGLRWALWLSIPVALLWCFAEPALLRLGQSAEISHGAGRYVVLQLVGLPPYLLFQVLRGYLQATGVVLPVLGITLLANAVNLLLDVALVFGRFGAPALGLDGASLATAGTEIFLLLALLVWWRARGPATRPWRVLRLRFPDRSGGRRVLRYGGPTALQIGAEMWAFQIATVWAGWLGVDALAGHSVVIALASFTFMVPLGISIASVARVGQLVGAGRMEEAQRAAWMAFALGAAVMGVAAVVFLVWREDLPRLFTTDPVAIGVAASLLPVVASFQLVDGVQVVGSGILRAMGDTRAAAVVHLSGFYLAALPLGWWLAFPQGLGLHGIWWGLALGLTLVAVSFVVWVAVRGPARRDARVW